MRMPRIMMIMIFGMTSFFTHTQETPPEEQTQTVATEESTIPETPVDETSKELAQEMPTAETTPEQTPTEEPQAQPTPETTTEAQPLPTEAVQGEQKMPSETVATETTTEQPVIAVEEKNVTPEEITSTETAPKEEAMMIPAIETEEPVGIDTVSLEHPQGNWLFKRIWWERAEERYEKIRILVDSIWESRNKFFYARNQLDRTILDPFYINIGIDRGELQIILSEINDFLEKQREQQGDLNEQELALYETYSTEEETLKQLKLDVDMITNLDHAIDDALGTFMNQINRVRNYESDAWKNFKEIAHILDDTRARELYYTIEGAARNIKAISTYLEQEFLTHFQKLIDEAKNRVARVQSQMDALKERGVLFQRQTEQVEQQIIQDEEEEEKEEVKPKPKARWFDWIMSGFSTTFEYIWSVIRLPYDMIFGK